jgi:hypothetical protein
MELALYQGTTSVVPKSTIHLGLQPLKNKVAQGLKAQIILDPLRHS